MILLKKRKISLYPLFCFLSYLFHYQTKEKTHFSPNSLSPLSPSPNSLKTNNSQTTIKPNPKRKSNTVNKFQQQRETEPFLHIFKFQILQTFHFTFFALSKPSEKFPKLLR